MISTGNSFDTIAEQAEVFGWKATIEKRIPRSLESIDVELRKGDIKVAVEISSTTKPKHEIQNIKKCLEAGYDYILSVCSDDKRLSLLKTEVKKSFSFKERERIRFYPVYKVKDFLRTISSPAIVSENAIYEWKAQRKLPYVKVGRLLKFKRTDLGKWLEKKLQKEEDFDILDE